MTQGGVWEGPKGRAPMPLPVGSGRVTFRAHCCAHEPGGPTKLQVQCFHCVGMFDGHWSRDRTQSPSPPSKEVSLPQSLKPLITVGLSGDQLLILSQLISINSGVIKLSGITKILLLLRKCQGFRVYLPVNEGQLNFLLDYRDTKYKIEER